LSTLTNSVTKSNTWPSGLLYGECVAILLDLYLNTMNSLFIDVDKYFDVFFHTA